MTLSKQAKRSVVVALGFAAFVAASLVGSYLLSFVPSPRQACARSCEHQNKTGVLVYTGPATPKDGPAKDVLSECRCQ